MSEIYLTKIERKTIFTKSLIFVLIMFIISDLTVMGPVWINFIPWLYILGTLGSLKQIDSVLMCIIGAFTVFISSIITCGGVNFVSIINTIVALSNIILGIISGKMLYQFVLEHRLVKYIKHSKKVLYIVTIVLMFFSSYIMVTLNSGNIFSYFKSKSNLKGYISKTYDVDGYNIIQVKYNKKAVGKYVYKVKIDGEEVVFLPVTQEVFKDVNREERLTKFKEELKQEMNGKTKNILQRYSYISKANIQYDLEYSKMSIIPDNVIMIFELAASMEDNEMVYEEIAMCIKELQNIKEANKIMIKINGKTLVIYKENISNLTSEYIKGGFEIQEITE